MLNFLKNDPQRVIVVGDRRVLPETMEDAVRHSEIRIGSVTRLTWDSSDEDDYSKNQLALERGGPEAAPYAKGLDDVIESADVVFTHLSPMPKALLERALNLKAVLTCRGGLEHIDIDAAGRRNIPVVNVIRNAIPVAEFALGLIISLTRNIAASHHLMRRNIWKRDYGNAEFVSSLYTLTVGLAGLGNVGIELAIRLKALGVPMIAHDAWLDRERLARNGLADIEIVSLEELFERADVVSLHLRLTPENAGMIDRKYFSLMKKTAYFINVARGGLVNQSDLVEVLRQGRIAGAALDVYGAEPLARETGLSALDNVNLTPHIAGTTVDALAKSPYLLARAVDAVILRDAAERIANLSSLRL